MTRSENLEATERYIRDALQKYLSGQPAVLYWFGARPANRALEIRNALELIEGIDEASPKKMIKAWN